MKKELILSLGLAALLTSCGYSEDYDEMEYLTDTDRNCSNKCDVDQYCINGVCAHKQPGGYECYDHNHCLSGYCADFDRKKQDYIGICKSYGGQSCRIDSDCIFGECNNGICECSTHDGCEGQSLCDNGTCLPLVNCPTEETKKCILIHSTVPNASWASGNGASASDSDPYFGNMVKFELPDHYIYACGMLFNALSVNYVASNHLLESTAVGTLLTQLALRLNPTCFSMELSAGKNKDEIAVLKYKITPNDGIKDKLATTDGKYNVYFKTLVTDSGLMGTSRFQMEIGNYESEFDSQDLATFPTNGKLEEMKMKFPIQSETTYKIFFKGSSNTELQLDELLKLYCKPDFEYIDKAPKYNNNDVGCKTVKFLLTSLQLYLQVVDNIPTADPTASIPPKDKRSQDVLDSKK